MMELGAQQVIDYRDTAFEQHVSDIDVVFDAIGGETLQRSWSVLKPQGRMVTIATAEDHAADVRSQKAFFVVEPSREQLIHVARLIDAGDLRPFVDAVVPFSQVPEAYAGALPKRGHGKVVMSFDANEVDE